MRQQISPKSGVRLADIPPKFPKTSLYLLAAVVRILARAAARDWLAQLPPISGTEEGGGNEVSSDIPRSEVAR